MAFSGAVLCLLVLAPGSGAGTVPTGFQDNAVITGLSFPTVLRFASDGRVFVAQKNGVIKVFDRLSDTSPDTFADLSAQVHNFWDRGLLGMALDPGFTTGRPYVYVLYTYGVPWAAGPRRTATAARRLRARQRTAASSAHGSRGSPRAATAGSRIPLRSRAR